MVYESINAFIQYIRELIENDKMILALDELKNYLSVVSDKLRDEIILFSGRYHRLRKDINRGLIVSEQAHVEEVRLKDTLLEFLRDLPKEINFKTSKFSNDLTRPITVTLPEDTGLERIIGSNNLKQLAWIQKGLDLSSSVCRIQGPNGSGTGFLVNPNVIMTNNHVIPNASVAEQSVADFNFENDVAGNPKQIFRYKLHSEGFHTSPLSDLDYSLVWLEERPDLPPLKDWGFLSLDPNTIPVPSEHVTIIQHPGGGPKQIAITANQVIKINSPFIFYTTDTMRGSSGSPIFDDNWNVIAIHHAFGGTQQDDKGNFREVNKGILMSAIKMHAGELWP